VTHCSHALLLDTGSVVAAGEPRQVVNRYLDLLFGKERKKFVPQSSTADASLSSVAESCDSLLNFSEDVFATRAGYNPHEYRWGDGAATILDFYLASDNERYPPAIVTGETVKLGIAIKFLKNMVRPILGITIKTKEGVTVYGVNSETLEIDNFRSLGEGGTVVLGEAVFCCRLAHGDYFISLGIATKQGEEIVPHDRRYDAIHLQVQPATSFFGLVNLDLKLTAKKRAA